MSDFILKAGALAVALFAVIGLIILIHRLYLKSPFKKSNEEYKKDLSHILRFAMSHNEKRTEYLKHRFEIKQNGYENKRVRKKFPPEKLGKMSDSEIKALLRNLPLDGGPFLMTV